MEIDKDCICVYVCVREREREREREIRAKQLQKDRENDIGDRSHCQLYNKRDVEIEIVSVRER